MKSRILQIAFVSLVVGLATLGLASRRTAVAQNDAAWHAVWPASATQANLTSTSVSTIASCGSIREQSTIPLAYGMALAKANDLVYIADGLNGLRIFNVADPALPYEVGALDTPGFANDVAVVGNYAYVADDALRIIDVSNPGAPYESGVEDMGPEGWARSVAVRGNFAYVADGWSGLSVINVADKSNPFRVGFGWGPGGLNEVVLVGDYAYVTSRHGADGLQIYDISEPAAPVWISKGGSNPATGVAIAGDYAYVGGADTLRVLSIVDPAHPTEIATTFELMGTEAVAVAGDYVFVAGFGVDEGLHAFNVAVPTQPEIVGLSRGRRAYDILVEGQYLYSVSDIGSFSIDRFTGKPGISGRVTNLGAPLADVSICTQNGVCTLTDATGEYCLNDMAAGNYSLSASKPGYTFTPSSRSATVPPDAHARNFSAVTYAISGRVRDQAGSGIAGAQVCTQTGRCATTNSSGDYTITSLATGSYTVSVSKAQHTFTPSSHVVTIPPGKSNIDFTATNCAQAIKGLQPLLLIHGWGAGDTLEGDVQGFASLQGYLRGKGWIEGCNLFYATGVTDGYGYANATFNVKAIHDNLDRLARAIPRWNPDWNRHIDIVGHSYGGLNARFYLESFLYEEDRAFITVDNLYTLGSPHGGVMLSELYPGAGKIGIDHYKITEERPSALQLLEKNMRRYNERESQPADVCYRLIGGNFMEQENLKEKARGIWALYLFWPSPNDIGVSLRSSLNLESYSDRFSNVVTTRTDDMHGYMGRFCPEENICYFLGDLRSYVYGSSTFEEYVERIAASPAKSSSENLSRCRADANAARQTTPTVAQTPDTPLPTLLGSGVIPGGSNEEIDVNVDTSGESAFYVTTSGDASALTLLDPLGNLMTPATAEEDPNVEFGALVFPDSAMLTYVITDTLPGSWTMQLANTSETEMSFDAFVVQDQTLALHATVDESNPAGAPRILTAQLLDASNPVLDTSVTAIVYRPDGSEVALTLSDNGEAPDTTPGDGTYAASFVSTAAPGDYLVVFKASGMRNGLEYLRTAEALFEVVPQGASIEDIDDEYPIGGESGSSYQYLAVEVGIAATQSMSVTLSADLFALTGELITQTSTTALATSGSQAIELFFSGEAIRRIGHDGPYRVANVRLIDAVSLIQVDELPDLYETEPYDHRTFGIEYLPDVPQNVSPEDEAIEVARNSALSWFSSDPNPYETLTYDVYLDTVTPPTILVTANHSDSTYSPPLDLLSDTTYYWRVIARDESGLATEGPVWSFTTAAPPNQPPTAPTSPSPANAAANVAITAALGWAGSDPDNDPLTYELRFGPTNPPPQVVAGQSATSYDPPGSLAHTTTYYWQVVANDDRGGVTAGPVWSFTTAAPPNQPPDAPTSPSPANATTDVAITAALGWAGSDPDNDPLTYELRFGPTNPPPQVVAGQSATSYDPPGNLTPSTTYYWQIVADDGRGGVTPGPIWSFTTAAPPPATVIYLSSTGSGQLGTGTAAKAFTGADILSYAKTTNTWGVLFDASSVSITKNVGAFAFQGNEIILGLSVAQVVPGLGTTKVAPQDLIRFTPSSTGYNNTAGMFAWFFDGSDVGLTTSGEIIDALWIDAVGRLYISTAGSGVVPANSAQPSGAKVKFQDEDILRFTPSSTGATSAGTWELYWNPTSITGMSAEDINGYWEDPATGHRYVTIAGAFNIGNAAYGGKFAGNGTSILRFVPNPAAPGGWAPAEKLTWLATSATLPAKFAIDGIEMAR